MGKPLRKERRRKRTLSSRFFEPQPLPPVLRGGRPAGAAPGHNQVATLFGKVEPEPYTEGFHVVNPRMRFIECNVNRIY